MDVHSKITELINKREEIEQASVSLDSNNLSARERLKNLFDDGTFVEIGAFVKQKPTEFHQTAAAAEGVITGYGAVHGKLVFAFAQDSSVLKGSISEMHSKKIVNLVNLAIKAGAPIVSFIDSCGLRLYEGIDALAGYGEILKVFNKAMGKIIHICAVVGTSAGALSFLPAMSDYSVMLDKAEVFLSPPSVVLSKLGDAKTGTAEKAYKDGIVSKIVYTEQQVLDTIIEFIDFVCDIPVLNDDINRNTSEIEETLSNDDYDVKDIIKSIADEGKMIEMYGGQAKNIVTALISLNCSTVGVIASQNKDFKGCLTAEASKKACKFIGFLDRFSIPVVSLVDTQGFLPEKDENIEDCALIMSGFIRSEIPKISIVLGKAYGAGYLSMCSKVTGADIAYALPTAQIACLPADTGAVFINDLKIAQAQNPQEERKNLINEYKNTLASPYEAAKRGYIDDIIEPSTVRQLIISSLEMLMDKLSDFSE